MSRRRWISTIPVFLAALLLTSFAVVQAAGREPGSGPDNALPVPDSWQTLAPGQRTWYAFHYAGDRSNVLVRLTDVPAGSAAFAVWSPDELERQARGEVAEPTGRGAPNDYYGGDLIWAGSSSSPGTWYIVVDPAGQAQTWFTVAVTGSGVGNLQTANTQAPASKVPPSPAPVSSSPVVPQATPLPLRQASTATYRFPTPTPTRPAQDPAHAMPLPEGPQTLGPGQHVWYAFQYSGDRSRIKISLHAAPAGSATFTVWSPDVLQRWAEGYFFTPTGRGTASEVDGGDLTWLGGSIIRGTWYVIVEQSGSSATSYTLAAEGTGIDRTLLPAPVPTPTYSLPIPPSSF